MKHIIPLLIVVLLPACSLLGLGDEDVSARSRGDGVIVKNDTSERVYYFAVGRHAAAVIDWAPSLDPTNSVAAGDTRAISHKEIPREEGEDEVIVYWWHAERRGETETPGELNSIVVALE